MTIGIMCAEEAELSPLLKKVEAVETVRRACFSFHRAIYKGVPLVAVGCGVGKVAAAACCQLLISSLGADRVIVAGIAGGLSRKLSVGDVVISTDAVQHDFDVTAFGRSLGEVPPPGRFAVAADEELRASAVRAASALVETGVAAKAVEGRILTGDQFVSEPQRAARLGKTFGALAVEMEGAAAAQVCEWNGVPFVIVRAISDDAGDGAKASFQSSLELAGEISAKLVTGILDDIAAR